MMCGKIEFSEIKVFFERSAEWVRGDVDHGHVVRTDEVLGNNVRRKLLFGLLVVNSESSGLCVAGIGCREWYVGDAKR